MAPRYGIGRFEERQWRDQPQRWREDDPDEHVYRHEQRDLAPSSDPWQSHDYERVMRDDVGHRGHPRPAMRDRPDDRESERAHYYRDERGTDDYYVHEVSRRRDDELEPSDDRFGWPDRRPHAYTTRDERFGHPSLRGSRIDYDHQFVSVSREEDEDRCENCGHRMSRRRER